MPRNPPDGPLPRGAAVKQRSLHGAKDLNVIAIIAAFNEEDVISATIEHLVGNGIAVYLIDNLSTDSTAEEAAKWEGKGLIGIERFPAEVPGDVDPLTLPYDWTAILLRKEQLAFELGADWYIHSDADEFREAPWPDVSLRDAITWVDRLGYNAINFRLLNFHPTDDAFAGGDPREHFRYYKESDDRSQTKCWKNTGQPVALAPTGGHDVEFDGRRTFPIEFLLRHYPIRGQEHGRRKIFEERKGRFRSEELARGWHVHYNDVIERDHQFVLDISKLTPYRPDQVRLDLLVNNTEVRKAEAGARELRALLDQHKESLAALQLELQEKVALRDEMIRSLQIELQEKVADRDRTILQLQNELTTKVAEANDVIRQLQAGQPPEAWESLTIGRSADLQRMASLTLEEVRDVRAVLVRTILHLQNELTTKIGEANGVIRQLQDAKTSDVTDRRRIDRFEDVHTAVSLNLDELRDLRADLGTQFSQILRGIADLNQALFLLRRNQMTLGAESGVLAATVGEGVKSLREAFAGRVDAAADKIFEIGDAVRQFSSVSHDGTLREYERAVHDYELLVRSLRGTLTTAENELRTAKQERLAATEEATRLQRELEQGARDSSSDERWQRQAAELRSVLQAQTDEASQWRDALLLLQHRLAALEMSLDSRIVDAITPPGSEPPDDEVKPAAESTQAAAEPLDENRWSDRFVAAQRELARVRVALERVQGSKLWKFGSLYWRVRELTGGHPGGADLGILPDSAPLLCENCEAVIAGGGAPSSAPLRLVHTNAAHDSSSALAAAGTNAFDVVCFPIIDWDFRFQRPQQLMTQIARRGHRVFYVAQKFRSGGPPYRLRRLAENLWEVSLRGPSRNVYTDTLRDAEAGELFASVDALRRDVSLAATASILQLPFWRPIAERARTQWSWPLVYDCMDHHAGFSTATSATEREEERLLRTADLVVTSSDFLDGAARRFNDNVVLVRNGCEYEHFAQIQPRAREKRLVVGYYGAIADWFDSDLVADIAEQHPEWDVLLVGSTYLADLSRLSALPNVSMVGEKPYAEIPDWLARFDVAIIPFKRTPLTEATNPVKVYEMLAGGKPVVSVPIPEVVALGPVVRRASTAQEFAREIEAAAAMDGEAARAERRRFAAGQTWEQRYQTLAPAVRSAFPKASIIIVTYNNVHLTRQCLESLHARTAWPRYEVFVVDNASADETPAYLREAELEFPGITVILNEDNRGFAAANNQALERATGDVLVLLNNDTVLPRSWLWQLVRHLRADPTIGLLGPSTNAIGNEGMIGVGYSDVAEMPQWAEDYMRQHEDETFDIAMLAMFCVAMRRDVFEAVGLLDEQFGIGMFEDDDYAHRIREAGYRVVCTRDSFVHHWMKAAFGKIPEDEYRKIFERNRALYEAKWRKGWVPHKSA